MTAEPQSSNRDRRTAAGRQQAGRLWRLVLKELREILRDRRTIVTLVVMPILIYPLLAVVFQRFLVTSLSGTEEITYVIGVDSTIERQVLERQLEAGNALLIQRRREKRGRGFERRSQMAIGRFSGREFGTLCCRFVLASCDRASAGGDKRFRKRIADAAGLGAYLSCRIAA